MGFLTALYPWTKSFHVIAMVAWMAGMFYLPRLFVYHCDTKPGSVDSERFKVMEYRLMKQIINPAMIATWVFGVLLVLTPGVIDWSAGWWHVKLAAVLDYQKSAHPFPHVDSIYKMFFICSITGGSARDVPSDGMVAQHARRFGAADDRLSLDVGAHDDQIVI